ncbi:hypothetical protein I316_00319 [Kwoniella heveanensis BCC8398]|uniref:ABC transporter domain-containing protein n=1 Tax=Kwoniella heveanensis BCC8398 TaxID=1296120 RepID=A0A1B9H499_9TREE|nr:hypothetical protein I316_00319 [Kwoniella heveanensis BCC8398]
MPPKSLPLVRLPPNALIHRFGSPNTSRAGALLKFPKEGWTIAQSSDGKPDTATATATGSEAGKEKQKAEGWAIVGDAEGRKLAVETLLSRHRIHPTSPPPGPFPYISTILASSSTSTSTSDELPSQSSSHKPIRHLAFARPPPTGEFTDFTARYGSLLEEDRLSFRQTLNNLHPPPSADQVERVARLMNIERLLDLPSVSLSSGQTRRARIASALLTQPVLLILEDPMAGLDVSSREEVSRILGQLNGEGGIRIVLVLRAKGGGDMPEWITDVAEVRNGEVWIGSKEDYERSHREEIRRQEAKLQEIENEKGQSQKDTASNDRDDKAPLVKLQDVSVSYGEGTRKVLNNVSWTIKPGEKWHLVGANGSGKTTLLSLILGHHPRSFSLPATSLTLFDKPRRSIPTAVLRQKIGHTSPEIYASFPRGMGLSAYAAVGSGFEGVFSRRNFDEGQKKRILALIDKVKDLLQPASNFAPSPSSPSSIETATKTATGTDVDIISIAKRPFSHFTPPQQGLLLFLRAIVGRPRFLILDEPSQGLDEVIWERCKGILEEEWASEQGREMGVVVVSHYEDEVPWKKGHGKVLKLDQGTATVE